MNRLQELEEQLSLLKESLHELSAVQDITETTSNMLMKQEEIEDRITLSILNRESNYTLIIYIRQCKLKNLLRHLKSITEGTNRSS